MNHVAAVVRDSPPSGLLTLGTRGGSVIDSHLSRPGLFCHYDRKDSPVNPKANPLLAVIIVGAAVLAFILASGTIWPPTGL